MKVSEFYQQQLKEKILAKQKAEKEVKTYTWLRLLVFTSGIVAIYLCWPSATAVSVSFVCFISLFLWIVSKSVDAKLKLEKAILHCELIELELEIITHKKSPFDCGAEFASPKHAFANDLDLFNKGGVFGFFNRTSSKTGKSELARLLLFGSKKPVEVQEQVAYLSEQMEWSQAFRVAGSINSRANAYDKKIADFVSITFVNPAYLKILSILIPVFSIGSLIAYNLDFLSETLFGTVLVVALSLVAQQLKSTNAWAASLSNYEARLVTIYEQIQLLQQLDGFDAFGKKSDLQHLEDELKKILAINKRFEIRLNILVSIPLNLFAAWDFRQRLGLEAWVKKNASAFSNCETELATLEALISAATVRFNFRDETCFALIDSKLKTIDFDTLTHPLIQKEKCVPNDFHLAEKLDFVILTGPNMAGKSTFLRAIGIGICCANAGFPVFAKTMTIPALDLFTSMRTSDDLTQESSYFHAELTRLRQLKNAVNGERQLFVLLDEILKGTNSKDKEEGSKKFLLKLQSLGIKGIIATHDLSLCVLTDERDGFENFYFDSTILLDELSFDYKVKQGICKNMNASFLLKKMELID